MFQHRARMQPRAEAVKALSPTHVSDGRVGQNRTSRSRSYQRSPRLPAIQAARHRISDPRETDDAREVGMHTKLIAAASVLQ